MRRIAMSKNVRSLQMAEVPSPKVDADVLKLELSASTSAHLLVGSIYVDLCTVSVRVANASVALTRLEFDLLVYLMRNASRVVSSQELMQQVVQSVYRRDYSVIRF